MYAKDPTEIHGIKRRSNEGLQAFMDRFKLESSHIEGVLPVLHIFAFMHGHDHSELVKKLNEKIAKIVDDMFERVKAFIRGEVMTGSAEIEEDVASGKLAHLVKDIRKGLQGSTDLYRRRKLVRNHVRALHKSFGTHNKSKLRKSNAPLVRFSGETYHPQETGRNPLKERGSIRLDPDSRHGCASVHHGAQVENVSLSRTYDPKEETPKPRPKRALKKKVFEWLKARVIKRVQYLGWVTNVIPIKQRDDNWKMHMDFASLNKVYPKDMYPFLEVKEKLRSLIGHRYKCFPRRVAKMIDKVIAEQKGRNVEVYLEEKVVKSISEQDLIHDVKETLYKLQRVSMKLDPSECAFGMKEGKFIGYIVMVEGRKADPGKVKSIISGSTHERPENKMQVPIYCVSRSLQGMEICYTLIEKAVLALVHMTRCLRNIFRFYKIKVVTNDPMEKMLKNPRTSDRLALWAIKLKMYHILYIPRKEVEVQVVEKFFGRGEQEFQALEKDNEASREGSGIGVILIDLEGKEYSHATRLNLHASKDDIDYEALLAGLAASARRQMKDLHVFVNSKLLVDQVEGNREPKKKGAKIYREEPKREGVQGVEEEGTRTGSQEGPFAPAQLAQTNPSPAFIKENIDVLRTMIKKHD
nr:hypothetical protein [Tanacetum cinerariifolium]